jgi:hypothetical protein
MSHGPMESRSFRSYVAETVTVAVAAVQRPLRVRDLFSGIDSFAPHADLSSELDEDREDS